MLHFCRFAFSIWRPLIAELTNTKSKLHSGCFRHLFRRNFVVFFRFGSRMDLYDGIHETWARANWTQLTGAVYYNNQQQLAFHRPRCADLEMNAIECLEAYGAHRGRLICEDYLTDMLECMYHHKQVRFKN